MKAMSSEKVSESELMSSYSTRGLITVPTGAASEATNPMSLECLDLCRLCFDTRR